MIYYYPSILFFFKTSQKLFHHKLHVGLQGLQFYKTLERKSQFCFQILSLRSVRRFCKFRLLSSRKRYDEQQNQRFARQRYCLCFCVQKAQCFVRCPCHLVKRCFDKSTFDIFNLFDFTINRDTLHAQVCDIHKALV